MAETHTSDEVRAEFGLWLQQNWSPMLTLREWWSRLGLAGWATPTWPVAWFGRGMSEDSLDIIHEMLDEIDAPRPPHGAGPAMGGPVIVEHGTDEQRARLLPPAVTGADHWCQLFSEPGAGSDLASVQTTAVRDGNEWVVNGQKTWTSGALLADHGLLVARTDLDKPKHRGISFFIMPMDQPGVEIRPIKQINGSAHFNEVFMTDVRVPDANLIGGLNNGWAMAMATLGYERNMAPAGLRRRASLASGEKAGLLDRPVAELEATADEGVDTEFPLASAPPLIELARNMGCLGDPHVRQNLMRLYVLGEIGRFTALRIAAARQAGRPPGSESSIGYLAGVARARASRDLVFQILGPHGGLVGPGTPEDGAAVHMALSTLAHGIQGGSEQIQRNILGERALGLPKEPQVDRDIPFRQLRVGTQRG